MIGTWTATIHAVRPFTIHSDLYYELHVTRPEQPDQLLAIRAPQHAARTAPTEGQTVVVTFLMGQVTNIEPSMGS
jgi:hypothetical protein